MSRVVTRAVTSAAVASAPHIQLWKSPIPYLFGGLALTMLLIAGALIVLACSYRKLSSDAGEKDPVAVAVDLELAMEPRVLVIMAGNDAPTYLGMPAAAAGVPLCCSCSARSDREDDRKSSG